MCVLHMWDDHLIFFIVTDVKFVFFMWGIPLCSFIFDSVSVDFCTIFWFVLVCMY